LIPQRELAVDPLAEVAVALEPRRDVGKKLRTELALQVEIDADIGAVMVARVARRKTGKDRRAGRSESTAAGAVLSKMAAVDPRRRLARIDLELLRRNATPSATFTGAREADVHALRQVQGRDRSVRDKRPAKNES